MTREEAVKEIEKAFEPAFANYIITALIEGATVSDKEPTAKNDLAVDCISRQQAIGAFPDLLPNMGYNKKAITEILQEVPSVTLQEPRWIPVSEKLPEANRAVLTYIDTGATKTYCLAYWNDVREAWEEWIGYDLIEKDRYYKVIAWMPLPTPFEPQESEVKE